MQGALLKQSYTITWTDYDGTIPEVDRDVAYGSLPSYDGETPSRQASQSTVYSFSGWGPQVEATREDATYVALYEAEAREYTITWMNRDTVLGTTMAEYGTMSQYSGDTPLMEGDTEYSYSFSGWSPELAPVSGDILRSSLRPRRIHPRLGWRYHDLLVFGEPICFLRELLALRRWAAYCLGNIGLSLIHLIFLGWPGFLCFGISRDAALEHPLIGLKDAYVSEIRFSAKIYRTIFYSH